MSMGFLPDAGKGVSSCAGRWSPSAVATFLTQINWGQLDYLVIDLPPGTGDAQLTLCQTAPLTGAVIVTTPQDVSLIDARQGAGDVPPAARRRCSASIENMSYFVGDDGKRYEIFRHGGGRKLATEAGVPFLGETPDRPAGRRVRRRRRADRPASLPIRPSQSRIWLWRRP